MINYSLCGSADNRLGRLKRVAAGPLRLETAGRNGLELAIEQENKRFGSHGIAFLDPVQQPCDISSLAYSRIFPKFDDTSRRNFLPTLAEP